VGIKTGGEGGSEKKENISRSSNGDLAKGMSLRIVIGICDIDSWLWFILRRIQNEKSVRWGKNRRETNGAEKHSHLQSFVAWFFFGGRIRRDSIRVGG